MAVEGKRGSARPDPGDPAQETVTADALLQGGGDDVVGLVEMHRKVAARLLAEGSPSRAFGELVRASRAIPMTRRLASNLVSFSLKAGTEPAAVTLLQSGIEDADGVERAHIRRQLARLFRKLRELERAREVLTQVLAERPTDRRARRMLNALLEEEGRWEELDASLEKEAKDALKRSQLRRAARATLQRARVYERLENHPRAALRYAQAAQYLETANEAAAAFDLRLLWLRSLRKTEAPERAMKEAVEVFLKAASAAGQPDRARAMLDAFGLTGKDKATAPRPKVEKESPPKDGRSKTQQELLLAAEVAEASGRAPEAAALFTAAVAEGPDPQTLRRLEAHYVARRAWRELAQFYRDRAAAAKSKEEKVESLTRLAELLEDELQDLDGAARAYEEIVQVAGDSAALKEQVRLLAAKQDQSAVRRAFDAAVDTATTDTARTAALAARGEAALRKKDFAKAKRDFEAAVAADPGNLHARAGLAEAAAKLGDTGPIAALRDALKAAPRRFAGRVELLRRFARLAVTPLGDAVLAKWAWGEVLAETPGDEEAEERLADLARKSKDDVALEAALSAQIRREPRGPRTRLARIERFEALERLGRKDDALASLREAVRFEPGHKEAWLLLSDRLASRAINGEAAWSMEQAATATEDDAERAETWIRAGRFVRERLKDEARAQVLERRGRKILEERASVIPAVPIPSGPRAAAEPPRRGEVIPVGEDGSEREPTDEVAPASPAAGARSGPRPAIETTNERREDAELAPAGAVRSAVRPALDASRERRENSELSPAGAVRSGARPQDASRESREESELAPAGAVRSAVRPALDASRERRENSELSPAGAVRSAVRPALDASRDRREDSELSPAGAVRSSVRPQFDAARDRREESELAPAGAVRSGLRPSLESSRDQSEFSPAGAPRSGPRAPADASPDRREGVELSPAGGVRSAVRPQLDAPRDRSELSPAGAVRSPLRPAADSSRDRREDAELSPAGAVRSAVRPSLDSSRDRSELSPAGAVRNPLRPPIDASHDRAEESELSPGGAARSAVRPSLDPSRDRREEAQLAPAGGARSGSRPALDSRAPVIPAVTIPAPPRAAPEDERMKTESGGTDPDAKTPAGKETVVEMEAAAPKQQAVPQPSAEPEVDDELVPDAAWRDSEDRSGAALASYSESSEETSEVDNADVLEVTTGDLMQPAEVVEEWDAPPGEMEKGPSTVELPVPLGEGEVPATPSVPHPAVQKLKNERALHLARVREDPLDAGGYHALAEYFDHVGDADRKALMSEIAHALEGDPDAAPRAPKLILSATDRAGLRHPALRGEAGELLALTGVALCRAHPTRGKAAGSRDEFRLDAGRGAQSSADALLAAVRILGLRAPDLFISEDNGPPFSLAHTAQGPRILVGRLAVKKLLPEAELRFFAGRALFTQNPDLLALRTLKKEELARGLTVLAQVVRSGRNLSGEARAIREGLAPKAMPRIQELLAKNGRDLPWSQLADGARHSANRAGLVVCGGVAPALQALRAKKALRSEMVELVRFAASERYLRIRTRRLG